MAKVFSPVVVDISHHNTVTDFAATYAAGIRGVIHKSSQGATLSDKTYTSRRKDATAAGLLWGAYHFADSSNVANQVSSFLRCAAPDDNTLLALDWEDQGSRTMSLDQAKEFLQLVFDRTGQRPLLYSGNVAKEKLGARPDPFLNRHRLWLCQYGPVAKYPAGWDKHWLWQFSADGSGPLPHSVAGIKDIGVDLNVFGGTDLAAEWVCREGPVVVPIKKTEPDKPIVATSPADRPEPKPPTNTPDPVPAKTGFTVKDLMPVSRKAFRLVWLKRAVHATWISFSADKLMEYMGVAQNYRHQVESFVSDHSTVLVITGGLTVVAIISGVCKLMASDASSGTYIPSGLTPENAK